MAKFITTRQISSGIEQLIEFANKYLILACPFIKLQPSLLQLLHEAADKGVRIIVIHGKQELNFRVKSQLEKIPRLELYFVEHLHAKCYFNEQSLIISSMNLYDFSEVHNWEMGILIERKNDGELYDLATREVKRILKSIAKASQVIFDDIADSPKSNEPKKITSIIELEQKFKQAITKSAPEGGFCIRCGEKIPADCDHPYCRKCFKDWKRYENPEYIERFCHLCGKPTKTKIDFPVCIPCVETIQTVLGR